MPRRPARQRRRRLHPRLLAAAPPPEARRGGARAVPDRRRSATELYRASQGDPAGRPATSAPAPCEFLVGQDGTISFLEVNTRLQVEHPVTEEVAGIDLVREQFRIADGEALGYDDPALRGHSIEFRINGEDPGRGFLPAPGRAHRLAAADRARACASTPASRPGDVIGGKFDSLLAKLIVTGATAQQALERSRRALDEFEVEGIATVLPFHRVVVATRRSHRPTRRAVHRAHPLDRDRVRQHDPAVRRRPPTDGRAGRRAQTVVVEVGGKRLEVVLPGGLGARRRRARGRRRRRPRASARRARAAARASGDAVTAPDAGHRSSRSPSRRARRSPPATSSSSSRR